MSITRYGPSIHFPAGTSATFRVSARQYPTGGALDLTGATITGYLKRREDTADADAEVELTVASGGIVIADAVAGIFDIVFAPEDTAPEDYTAGRPWFRYVRFEDADGKTFIIAGTAGEVHLDAITPAVGTGSAVVAYAPWASISAEAEEYPESTYATIAALTAHIDDAVGAHAASAISTTPSGSLSGTTVAAQLAELDTEKAPADLSGSAQQAEIRELAQLQVGLGAAGLPALPQRLGATKPHGISHVSFPANYTVDVEIPIPAASFSSARIAIYNTSSAAVTWFAAAAAAAPSSGSSGTALTWQQIAFSTPTVPSRMFGFSSGGSASVTVPAGVGTAPNVLPGIAYSDWFTLVNVARTDGGNYPLMRIRLNQQAGAFVGSESSASQSAYAASLADRCPRSAVSADATGEKVTSAASHSITPSLTGNWMPPILVEFRAAGSDRVITVAATGDSITAGTVSASPTTRSAGYIDRACEAVSDSSLWVSHVNLGYPSSSAWSFLERGKMALDWVAPSVLFLFGGSPNDGQNCDLFLREVKILVGLCVQRGCVPVLVTMAPAGEANDNRTSLNTALRSMATLQGLYLLDADEILADPNATDDLLAAYDSGDGIHPSEAGHIALAEGAEAILASIIA